jgi:uncharacterized OB-fold protein
VTDDSLAALPEGAGPEAVFRAHLKAGRFMIQRCRDSGVHVFYPRLLSPATGRPTLDWVAPSGRGTVYSTTIIRQHPDKGGDYNVALIDLAEGPRMMSRVVGIPPEAVHIGQPVRAAVELLDGAPAVVFRPDRDERQGGGRP